MSVNPPSGLSHCLIILAVIGAEAVSRATSMADDVRAVALRRFWLLSEALFRKDRTVVVSFTD